MELSTQQVGGVGQTLAQVRHNIGGSASAPSGRSCARPPGRMKAWFIRRPVIESNTSRIYLALPEAERHRGQRAEFHTAGRQADEVRGDAVELHEHHPDDGPAPGSGR
jgi:hypothetical protein